eukprot:5969899-Amphidinium_carterae.1
MMHWLRCDIRSMTSFTYIKVLQTHEPGVGDTCIIDKLFWSYLESTAPLKQVEYVSLPDITDEVERKSEYHPSTWTAQHLLSMAFITQLWPQATGEPGKTVMMARMRPGSRHRFSLMKPSLEASGSGSWSLALPVLKQPYRLWFSPVDEKFYTPCGQVLAYDRRTDHVLFPLIEGQSAEMSHFFSTLFRLNNSKNDQNCN